MRHGLDTSFLVAVEVACHPEHTAARAVAESLRRAGDRFVVSGSQCRAPSNMTCAPSACRRCSHVALTALPEVLPMAHEAA